MAARAKVRGRGVENLLMNRENPVERATAK
jgi:hypothetical protein